ncbi:MAG TPA: ABC transporter ATP-binding protein [Chloroflexi bacterium]|nr:MAG: ABC transporter ATP-binding protein [Chloroflexota bacterium]HDD55807.1 ABC transporter ATP-binding protein [Chloroflexota bacterium]
MILTENLTKYFKDLRAVDGVDLHVRAGEVLALLGPNGAGKTTTVRMLTTVLRPSDGTARVAGCDVLENPGKVRSSVGVLTEDHGLYDRMHIEEYLDFFGQIYDMPAIERQQRIQYLLSRFGLLDARNRRIGKFSKGMRQKLSLARSLLHSPPVLLLDEPTSAMDPASARLVRNAIKTLRSEDRAIIVCTHNLAEAEELADKIAIIRNGKIIANGSAAELKEQLLGPGEYKVQLVEPLDSKELPLPDGLVVTQKGLDWFSYRAPDARKTNPQILHKLITAGYQVVKMEEVQRSLESVYLQAVNHVPVKEDPDVE